MKMNRLSKNLAAALNAQMSKEAQTSQIYLSYASWSENRGFGKIANMLFVHAEEKRNHMMKILEYILKRGSEVHIAAIAAPTENPVSINSCFEKVFEHEMENTKAVNKLVKMSIDEEDWETWKFMKWFANEQIEEETYDRLTG
jgi:ferritin